jgi:hypothetical protein
MNAAGSAQGSGEPLQEKYPRVRWIILAAIVAIAVVVTVALKPIPQPLWYHNFADSRALWGVPNSLNVLSNLPFVLVGLAGLFLALRDRSQPAQQRLALAVLFFGLFMTGLGSAYYHLAPDNQRLLWDRLPMTIAMAGIVSFLLLDRLKNAGVWILPILLAIGMGAVLQWSWSEAHGHGDLRWYAMYEALIIIVAALLLLMFPRPGSVTRALLIALAANIAAKLFELCDRPVYNLGQLVSGHTLKHLAAGLGFIPLVMWLASRKTGRDKVQVRATAR